MGLQARLARAREGKDGRPPRLDPVLDEVAAKLEKEVARIKLGEMAATEIGDCLKAKSASQGRAAAKAPVNSGLKPPSDSDDKQLRVPVDEEMTVKEKAGAKETNLVKEAALLKEANIVKESGRAGLKETHPMKLSTPSEVATRTREAIAPVKPAGPAKVIVPGKMGAVSKVNAVVEVKPMVMEKVVVKDCPCLRPLRLIMCADCGVTFAGRVRVECPTHPRALFLQDVSSCTSCKQADISKLMEFDLPAGMEESLRKL